MFALFSPFVTVTVTCCFDYKILFLACTLGLLSSGVAQNAYAYVLVGAFTNCLTTIANDMMMIVLSVVVLCM